MGRRWKVWGQRMPREWRRPKKSGKRHVSRDALNQRIWTLLFAVLHPILGFSSCPPRSSINHVYTLFGPVTPARRCREDPHLPVPPSLSSPPVSPTHLPRFLSPYPAPPPFDPLLSSAHPPCSLEDTNHQIPSDGLRPTNPAAHGLTSAPRSLALATPLGKNGRLAHTSFLKRHGGQ